MTTSIMSITRRSAVIDLTAFFAAAFAITWGIAAFLLLAPETMERLFGRFSADHPLFYLAVCAPSLAAVIVSACRGRQGIGKLLAPLRRWKVSLGTALLLTVAYGAMQIIAREVVSIWFGPPSEPALNHWRAIIMALPLVIASDPGPWGEELGWRGFALPRLQLLLPPLPAALLLGTIWAAWHIPAFLLSGTTQNGGSFAALFVGAISLTMIMTFFMNRTGGNLLFSAMLIHFLANNAGCDTRADAVAWLVVAIAFAVFSLAKLGGTPAWTNGLLPTSLVRPTHH